MEHDATTRYAVVLLGLLLLVWGSGIGEGVAQTLSAEERARLTPRLRPIVTAGSPARLGPLLRGTRLSSNATGEVGQRYGVFVHASDLEALREMDLSVREVGPGLATARVTAAELRRVVALEEVRAISPARTYEPLNDVARGVTGVQAVQDGALGQKYTGNGVLACVIDTGIDWAHRDFRASEDASKSRIRSIWDQTLRPQSGETTPAGFDYGVEYTREDVEDEIDGSPTRSVRSTDTNGHGTHVAGTVAGNGGASPDRIHRGMAPEADIVAVKTDFSGTGIADGLQYCGRMAEAERQPVVVTLGSGAEGGPHDGSSALAQSIDHFVGAGRTVVVAAGNGGDAERHVARTLSPGGADSLRIQVPRYQPREGAQNDVAFRLDIWLPDDDRVPMTVLTPRGQAVPVVADSAAAVRTGEGTVVYEESVGPQGARHIEIVVLDEEGGAPPAAGRWAVAMKNDAAVSTTVHSWLVETTTKSRLLGGDRRHTLSTPATARGALTVGAWTPAGYWSQRGPDGRSEGEERSGVVAPFSGRGPLLGGGKKPDLVAPGQWTVSSRARTASIFSERTGRGGDYAMLRGTSTAAATTAGAVALLLQQNPSLSAERAATILTESARTNGDTERPWTADRGHGTLDLYRAMAKQRGITVATREQMAYDRPATGDERTAYTLGGGKTESMAVRFTPSRSARVNGLYVRTGSGPANRLRDSLQVEVWTDREGRPGQPVGGAVQIAPDALGDQTMNFVSLAEAGVVVEKGTDYHLVLTPGDGGGELDVMAERRSVDGRSALLQQGSWTALSTADLAIRVSTAMGLELPPPQLAAPAPTAIRDGAEPVTVSWEAVPDAAAYTIQVSSSPRFAPPQTDTLKSRSLSQSLAGLTPGTAYHWRVRGEYREYTGAWSSTRSFLVYPAAIDVRVSRSIQTGTGDPGYRLVALPGRGATSVSRTVDGNAGDAWQAFWDTGAPTDAFVSVGDGARFRFRPGNGVWLRSEEAWTARTSVPTVPLSDDGTYEVELHEGWNVISNPFEKDVAWSAVEATNDGALPPLWRYTGRFEQATTFASARTGEAFYVLNDQGREALRIPYPAFPDAPSGGPAKSNRPPAMTLTASQGESLAGQVRVGITENADDGRDEYDQVAPPDRFADTSFRIESGGEDVPGRQRHLAAEYRSTKTDGHTFSLVLRAEPGTPVEIRAEGVDAFEGQEVVLIDPDAGTSYDLRTGPTITIQPDEGPRSLRLLVGSPDYVEAKKNVTLPSELQFLPNYPNPFRQQTTLEYVLPEPGAVRLAVYDVLGRQVRVLVDQKQKAGRHTVAWNGRDESGKRMASGVYLARLVVDGQTKVRKLTFVR